ncbi:hypothetical protein PR202_gb25605 [Eleusine coracana subsp. coracana]|uniref:Uncharacterized protein n=1 Tax=Eleusine coracana subsp. coracana TaxID=191504 RepID=A0AAV5FP04_ELECO|nr:hypothetical protein PR202_gb25605 [Eleusine coracana subsp. coracana]
MELKSSTMSWSTWNTGSAGCTAATITESRRGCAAFGSGSGPVRRGDPGPGEPGPGVAGLLRHGRGGRAGIRRRGQAIPRATTNFPVDDHQATLPATTSGGNSGVVAASSSSSRDSTPVSATVKHYSASPLLFDLNLEASPGSVSLSSSSSTVLDAAPPAVNLGFDLNLPPPAEIMMA